MSKPSPRPPLFIPGLALLAALPSLAALLLYGTIETPDSTGYIAYATQIRTLSLPTGQALLHSAAGNISLFRMGGFPALLAALQIAFPSGWKLALALAQIVANSGVAVACYFTARRLGITRHYALAAALLPSIGFVVIMNLCILTDALYSAAVAGAACALVLRPDWRGALLAGLLLAAGTTFREATIYLVVAFLPLALLTRRHLLCVLLVVLPVWGIAGAQIAWNMERGAGPVLTTVQQLVMVQALLPLIHDHVPVYADNPSFAAAAVHTIDLGGYARIDAFEAALTSDGLTAPQIATEASREYVMAWLHYPLRMAGATLGDFRKAYLFMPFQPLETIATIQQYKTGIRPAFDLMNVQAQALRAGRPGALLWIIAVEGCQVIGTAIALIGLIAPWRIKGAWTLRALWCLPVGMAGLYMPVHLEPRYLAPVVPVICILAAAGASRWMPGGTRSYNAAATLSITPSQL